MLSVKQAAQHARVSETILRGWIAEGLLPHFRLGARGRRGKIVIDQSDLDAFLASRKVTSHVAPPAPKRVKPITLRHLRPPS